MLHVQLYHPNVIIPTTDYEWLFQGDVNGKIVVPMASSPADVFGISFVVKSHSGKPVRAVPYGLYR